MCVSITSVNEIKKVLSFGQSELDRTVARVQTAEKQGESVRGRDHQTLLNLYEWLLDLVGEGDTNYGMPGARPHWIIPHRTQSFRASCLAGNLLDKLRHALRGEEAA
jgi:hypothetical protein